MVDSELVAVGAEAPARLTDLGVMPKPGGEASRRGPIIGVKAPCAMIVTMAYDEDLANRIRELIASEDGYTEQKMFGGIGFMIDGHMAVGVSGEGGLMIHCSKEETEALLAKPGARPFEMRGREMKGWLRVDAESVSTKRALEPWAMQSVAFARALPPKEKK
jgi:TfoX/Sxy family transcriptional regulator of competence genes